MPTKQELETINDELLTENSQLRREQTEQGQHLAELTESLESITARLETLASQPPQPSATANSPDALAAQIEPLVTGLKAMIERAKLETIEQNKRAQILQTMLDRNEGTNREFSNHIRAATVQSERLSAYLDKWQGQPRMTMLKVTGAMFLSTILAGLLIGCLVLWSLSPTRQLIEDASKWRALSQAMTPEQIRQIENQLNQRGQESGVSAPPTTNLSTPAANQRR
jgi:hypothetical protein